MKLYLDLYLKNNPYKKIRFLKDMRSREDDDFYEEELQGIIHMIFRGSPLYRLIT